MNSVPVDSATPQLTARDHAPVADAQVMKIAEMVTESAQQNGIEPELALKIAECESNLRQFGKQGNVLRGIDNPEDVGVFQINETYHLEESQKQGFNIYTAEGNIDYAMSLLKQQGSKPWHWSKKCWIATEIALNS